jgi:DNA-3-methyladenine glycosylase II
MTTEVSIASAVAHLRRRDPVLAAVMRNVGPCRLAPARSHFMTLVEAIVWQQLSWHAANAIHQRLLDVLGTRRPRPRDVLQVPLRQLRAVGLSQRKAEYLNGLARHFEEGRFPARRIHRLSDEEIVSLLGEIRGIGRWSAEMFLIFALNRLDVFPVGDLGLRKAIGRHYAAGGMPTDGELARIADPWRPFRTIASWYLWAAADSVPL